MELLFQSNVAYNTSNPSKDSHYSSLEIVEQSVKLFLRSFRTSITLDIRIGWHLRCHILHMHNYQQKLYEKPLGWNIERIWKEKEKWKILKWNRFGIWISKVLFLCISKPNLTKFIIQIVITLITKRLSQLWMVII